jgi:hypothetical protein
MSHAYSLGSSGSVGSTAQFRTATRRPGAVRRSYRTIVLSLMFVTSTIAVVDLYLFASSGFH